MNHSAVELRGVGMFPEVEVSPEPLNSSKSGGAATQPCLRWAEQVPGAGASDAFVLQWVGG